MQASGAPCSYHRDDLAVGENLEDFVDYLNQELETCGLPGLAAVTDGVVGRLAACFILIQSEGFKLFRTQRQGGCRL